jgi:hypothetical protein
VSYTKADKRANPLKSSRPGAYGQAHALDEVLFGIGGFEPPQPPLPNSRTERGAFP